MEKITLRTKVCLFLALLLTIGVGLFVFRFFHNGHDWVSYSANDHLYHNGVLASGVIRDREGAYLAGAEDGYWSYNDSSLVRISTLHAVGDSKGKIGVGAMTAFADKLSGYNMITGTRTLFGGERNLYLTIDCDLCAAAYEAMGGLKGCVGLYNYKTGDILCDVSGPSYDPLYPESVTEDDASYDGVYINRLFSSTFIPGSTMKIVTCAAAYDKSPGVLQRTFTCNGALDIGDSTITCTHPHGELTLQGALVASCNCTYGKLASELGAGTMQHYVDQMGLTDSYSIDGIKTKPSSFDFDTDDGYLAWSGVGQGYDQVNPCSMMVLAGAVANGGRAAVPHLISKVKLNDNLRVSIYYNHRTRRLLHEETAAYVAQAMRDDVTLGYGDYNFSGLSVGAKTGTAQSDDSEENNAWFVGFCTDEEHPYAFVVYLEGGGAGSGSALRVASTLLSAAISQGY